ncbi:hypothetical protein CNBJ3020 [Cryptococcus deneoformans B-3501A]|uniref:hypothetical protein n=1 Tax=Cryptococcus deneoformans (strain B-3501A) TaxID=283643 RepID=UPI000042DE81|nr:hypothetical protein CNBJ3020 [Cryptococcus neoformans var. neoformans B-3501A]EAL18379.1 hypothetical protein CNBJ3020 [Cryptococcus neoformans var. neoformans B-3501A]
MPAIIPFFIPDTSPIFTYTSTSSSLSNTFNATSTSTSSKGTDITDSAVAEVKGEGGWIAAYSPIGNGYDQTFHYGQGVISGNFSASALKFYTSSKSSNSSAASLSCPAEYRLNASSTWSSACASSSSSASADEKENGKGDGEGDGDEYVIDNLPAGTHQVELRSVGGNVEFLGIGGLLDVGSSGKMSNLTVDNTSPSFIYSSSSSWSQLSSPISSASSSSGNSSFTSLFNTTIDNFYNETMSITTEEGAKVELNFEGEAIYVYGFSSVNGGKGEVWLDGVLQGSLNMIMPWDSYSSLLYVGSGFSASNHTLTITNTFPGGQLVIDYVLLTVKTSSSYVRLQSFSSKFTTGGTSAFFLILGAIAYILYVRRRLPVSQRNGQPRYAFSKGYGNRDYMSQDAGSKVDLWRKMMGGTSTPGDSLTASSAAPTPISFAKDGGVNLTPGSGSGMGTDRSPTPEYPDYVPYRGPIEPHPPHTASFSIPGSGQEKVLAYTGMTASPLSSAGGRMGSTRSSSSRSSTPRLPLVAGANPSATGWLLARGGQQAWNISPISSREGGEGLSRDGSQSTNRSGGSRAASLESWSAGESRRDRDREREDGFDEIVLVDHQAPVSPPPFSGVTCPSSRSGRSTGTGTKIVPQSPTSSISTPSSLGLSGIQARAVPASRSVARLWPARDAVPSSYRVDSSFRRGMSALSSASLALNPSTSVDALPHAPPNSTSSPTLRRGVSIKSIKTMRSFFSGLIFLPPSSNAGALQDPIAGSSPSLGVYQEGHQRSGSTSKQHHTPALPIIRSGNGSSLQRHGAEEEEEERGDGSPHFFIELNPNSPIMASRPASLWTRYTRASGPGFHGTWEP